MARFALLTLAALGAVILLHAQRAHDDSRGPSRGPEVADPSGSRPVAPGASKLEPLARSTDGGAREPARAPEAAGGADVRRTSGEAAGRELLAAAGFPLVDPQWRGDEGEWLPLGSAPLPAEARWVRAAGHRALELPDVDGPLQLEVDARLEVRGVVGEGVRVTPTAGRPAVAAVGANEAGEPLLAVDVGRWAAEVAGPSDGEIGSPTLRLDVVGGAALYVVWSPRSGERRSVRVQLPAGSVPRAADLALVEAPTADDLAAARGVTAEVLRPPAPVQLLSEPNLVLRLERGVRRWSFEGVRAGRIVLDGAPVGADLFVRWRRSDGWYARAVVRHRERDAVIDLRPPSIVVGRIVDLRGEPVGGVELSVSFDSRAGGGLPDLPRLARAWSAWGAATSSVDGRFELTLPPRLPELLPRSDLPEQLPVVCGLECSEPGWVDARRDVDLVPGGTVDVGDLLLERRDSDVALELAGAGEDFDVTRALEVGWHDREPGRMRWSAVELARPGPGGAGLVLVRAPSWGSDRPHALLLATPDGYRGLRLRGDAYEPVPSMQLDVAVDVPFTDFEFASVEFSWEGLEAQLIGVDPADPPRRVDRLLPASGATLGWSERRGGDERQRHDLGPPGAVGAVLVLSRGD